MMAQCIGCLNGKNMLQHTQVHVFIFWSHMILIAKIVECNISLVNANIVKKDMY